MVAAPFVVTVTVAVPGEAMRFAAMAAVNRAGLTNVVAKESPFQRTVELAANPKPLTVRINAAPPACAVDGFKLLICGAAGVIVNVELLLGAPFAELTVTVTLPGEAMRFAVMNAVN